VRAKNRRKVKRSILSSLLASLSFYGGVYFLHEFDSVAFLDYSFGNPGSTVPRLRYSRAPLSKGFGSITPFSVPFFSWAAVSSVGLEPSGWKDM